MPAEHRIDPTWLDVVATQLARSSAAALEASHELLAHYSDTGEAATQRAVDTMVNQAADTLSALAESLAGTSCTLQTARCPQGDADGSPARSGRGLDQGA